MNSLLELLSLATQSSNMTVKTEEQTFDSQPSFSIKQEEKDESMDVPDQEHSLIDSNESRRPYQRFREKQFICDDCSHTFTLKHNLKVHRLKYHTGDHPRELLCNRRLPCEKCGELFRNKTALRKHEIQQHKPKRPKRQSHACEQCDKVYLSPNQLREHVIAMHSEERIYKCDQCESTFGRPGGLRRHRLMVHTDHKYTCPFEDCDHPGYKCSKALAAHIRSVHTKERPFACSTCGKTFIRKNDLKVHEETHNTEARYDCEYCGNSFKRQVYFKKHQRRCKKHPNAPVAVKSKKKKKREDDEEPIALKSIFDTIYMNILADLNVKEELTNEEEEETV
ncbi:hypothetical protein M3Y98_00741700 [Aphelenchoides besseyi]|nr:hypothetical protein M3Y98_00741700 [Aphelenchoides besseyi]KAI6211463.1 hypothetical protein M3Y96_00436800 [Aphelenchoides besseyi]